MTDNAKSYFYQAHDIRYGARHLARKMRIELEPILAIYFLNHPTEQQIILDLENGHLVIQA